LCDCAGGRANPPAALPELPPDELTSNGLLPVAGFAVALTLGRGVAVAPGVREGCGSRLGAGCAVAGAPRWAGRSCGSAAGAPVTATPLAAAAVSGAGVAGGEGALEGGFAPGVEVGCSVAVFVGPAVVVAVCVCVGKGEAVCVAAGTSVGVDVGDGDGVLVALAVGAGVSEGVGAGPAATMRNALRLSPAIHAEWRPNDLIRGRTRAPCSRGACA
jgi:hypothetical protein